MRSASRALIVLSFVTLPGCAPFFPFNPGLAIVKPVSARGIWTGTLVPVDLYGKDYDKIAAVALLVDGGTALPSPRFVDSPPFGREAILVDRSWKVLRRDRFDMGARVEVAGLMKVDWVKDRTGTSVTHELGGTAAHYHSVHPERVRRLPAADGGAPATQRPAPGESAAAEPKEPAITLTASSESP